MNISPMIAYHVSNSHSSISGSSKKSDKHEVNIYKVLAIVCAVLMFLCAIGALVCTILHVAHTAMVTLGMCALIFFLVMGMFLMFSLE